MNNILVVDDEPIIVQGLFNILNDCNEFELSLWKAYSAKEAIKIMENNRIDILITDIRMVGMSGLELANIVRKQWSRCKIIFLTGHSNVEYLLFALRQGAYEYLLKPVDDEKIIEIVRSVVSEIEDEMKTTLFMEKAQVQIQHAQPVLKREFLVNLLEGQPQASAKLKEQLLSLNILLDVDSDLIVMVGRVDRWPEHYSVKDRLLLQYAINNIVEEYLSQISNLCSTTEGRYVVWLIQLPGQNKESDFHDLNKLHWYISEMLEKIQQSIRQVLDLPFSIVLSQPNITWPKVHQAYSAICKLFQRGIGLDEEIIIIDRNEALLSQDQHLLLHSQDFKSIVFHLRSLLENGEEAKFLEDLSAFLQSVQKSVFVDYALQMELFCTLSALFLAYMNTRKITEEVAREIELESLSSYSAHLNWSALTKYYLQFAKVLFKYAEFERTDQKIEIVKKIDDYILGHLSGDLSLNNLAKQVHLSSFYLSRLYQRQKGYSLSQRITEIKIDRAKQLLMDAEAKVQDITVLLGFDNIPYFTKFFKKQTGVSPQKFKESNRV